MFCPQCGAQNKDGAKFCSSCGTPLPTPQGAPQPAGAQTPHGAPQTTDAPQTVGVQTPAAHAAARGSATPGATAADYAARRQSKLANKGLLIVGGGALVVLVVAVVVVYNLFFAPWQIDEKHFPDVAVRNVVASVADTNHDGKLQRDEGKAVTSLEVDGAASFKGMGAYFPNLTSLVLSGSSLSSADVSDLGRLESLDARGTSIQSLDVSKNGKLTSLGLEPSVQVSGLDSTGLREVWLQDSLTSSYWSSSDGGWAPYYRYDTTYGLDGSIDALTGSTNDASGSSSQPDWEEAGSFTYDEFDDAGRPLSMTSESTGGSTYAIAYAYDDAGRISSAKNDDGDSYTFTYDDAGRLTKLDGGSTGIGYAFTYDDQGRVSGFTQDYYGSDYPYALSYDDAGNLTSMTEKSSYGDNTWTFAYDDQGRVTSATVAYSGSTYPYSTTYAYDDAGSLVSTKTNSGGNSYEWTLTYDDQGRVTHAESAYVDGGDSEKSQSFDVTYGARVFVAKDAADPAPGVQLIVLYDPSYSTSAVNYTPYSPAFSGLSFLPTPIRWYVTTSVLSSNLL